MTAVRKPQLEPYTLWHVNFPGGVFAIRPRWLLDYPCDAIGDLVGTEGHLLHLWLAAQPGVRWYSHPEYLTTRHTRPRTTLAYQRYFDHYRRACSSLSGDFDLVDPGPPPRGADPGWSRYRLRPRRTAERVTVIVPFRDKPGVTIRCLTSLLRQRVSGELYVLLVDNGSERRSTRRIEDWLQGEGASLRCRIIRDDGAFNHSRLCNLGVRESSGEVVVFLNNDAELVDEDSLEEMSRWSLVPDVATVGCRITTPDGRLVCAGVDPRPVARTALDEPVEESVDPSFSLAVRETFANTFACAAISREVLDRLGPLNEVEFPAGYNDVEYCLRARRAGYRHIYLGHIRVIHVPGTTRSRSDETCQKVILRLRYPELVAAGIFRARWLSDVARFDLALPERPDAISVKAVLQHRLAKFPLAYRLARIMWRIAYCGLARRA
ncbi:MAG TPA: glycosyltransferase [Dehalococcoidia bacterium]|nr:glycosyltransferase [Dehalococcoidia bacterium]